MECEINKDIDIVLRQMDSTVYEKLIDANVHNSSLVHWVWLRKIFDSNDISCEFSCVVRRR